MLSRISPEIVGEPLEIDAQYNAINCLMSFMVNIFQSSVYYSARVVVVNDQNFVQYSTLKSLVSDMFVLITIYRMIMVAFQHLNS